MTLLLPSRAFKPFDIEEAFCALSSFSLSVNGSSELISRKRLTWKNLVWMMQVAYYTIAWLILTFWSLRIVHWSVLVRRALCVTVVAPASRDFLSEYCKKRVILGESHFFWSSHLTTCPIFSAQQFRFNAEKCILKICYTVLFECTIQPMQNVLKAGEHYVDMDVK